MHRILCTRALDNDWKQWALQHNIVLDAVNFLEISTNAPEAFKAVLQQNTDPLVFTSAHAVKALAELEILFPEALRTKACFCIAGNTSNVAVQTGFNILGSAPDGAHLARCIIESGHKAVLHCSSKHRRPELEQTVVAAGVEVRFCEVYEKVSAPLKVGKYDGIMFFSPSQIDAFLQENLLDGHTRAFCIGPTTGRHLADLGYHNIHVSPEASIERILQIVLEYFKQE